MKLKYHVKVCKEMKKIKQGKMTAHYEYLKQKMDFQRPCTG